MIVSINEFKQYLKESLSDVPQPGPGNDSPSNHKVTSVARISDISNLVVGNYYKYEYWKEARVLTLEFLEIDDSDYIMKGSVAVFRIIGVGDLFSLDEDEIKYARNGSLFNGQTE